MISYKLALFPLAILIFSACAVPVDQQDTLVLTNGLLIDGSGSEPVPKAVLVIRGEKIVTLGANTQVAVPRGARVIDLAGAAVLPGFINAHVHYGFDEQNLRAWAQGGVTTVRDESITSYGTTEMLKERMEVRGIYNQNPELARLVTAGFMFGAPNGYGQLPVTSPEDAREKVTAELDAGADLIKLSMEDGYAGRSGLPKLSDDEIAAIIAATHERGVLVSGHVTQAQYLKILVDAGVDDIAHIPYDPVSTEVWQSMVAQSIYMTPTFSVYRNYGAPIEVCVQNLHNFIEQGGQVALGSDYGGGPGTFELGIPMYEIEKMSEAGMTPMQIIVASTRNAAHVAHVEDQVGTLEAGKAADILVISGNPLDDLQNLQKIRMVIHNGMVIRDESQ